MHVDRADIRRLGSCLVVFPHPDDESIFTAGILAAAKRNGQRTVCVNLTVGRTPDEPEARTATRLRELGEAVEVLGVDRLVLGSYWDRGCMDVPLREGVRAVRAILEEEKPDAVFTYGPDGMTGHPDHAAVSAWTTIAFAQVARPGAALYYVVATPEVAERFGPTACPRGYHEIGAPAVVEEPDVVFALDDEIWRLKERAIRAHASEVPGIEDAMGKAFITRENRTEYFRLAMRGPPSGAPSA